MQTILKSRILKLAVAFMLGLILWLSILLPMGRASTSHQTIPTAPPTTEVIPTISPSRTPTNPPQTTIISTQPTQVQPSHTPSSTNSPTAETNTSRPTIVPTTTRLPGNGTIPVLTVTPAATEVIRISPTSSALPTSTVSIAIKSPISSAILFCLLGGGIVLIIVIGIIWFLKSRQR
jgi:hypothetical protein